VDELDQLPAELAQLVGGELEPLLGGEGCVVPLPGRLEVVLPVAGSLELEGQREVLGGQGGVDGCRVVGELRAGPAGAG
jgi:hypothetical protein